MQQLKQAGADMNMARRVAMECVGRPAVHCGRIGPVSRGLRGHERRHVPCAGSRGVAGHKLGSRRGRRRRESFIYDKVKGIHDLPECLELVCTRTTRTRTLSHAPLRANNSLETSAQQLELTVIALRAEIGIVIPLEMTEEQHVYVLSNLLAAASRDQRTGFPPSRP